MKVIVDNNFGTKYKVLQNYEHWLRISCWLDTAEQIEVRLRPIEFRMKISNIFHLLPILLLFCMLVRQLLSTMIFFFKVGTSVQKTCTWKEQQVLGDKDKKADYHDYDYYDRDRHRYQHFYNHNKRLGVRGCCYQGDKKIGSGEKVCWIKKCSPKQLYYLY